MPLQYVEASNFQYSYTHIVCRTKMNEFCGLRVPLNNSIINNNNQSNELQMGIIPKNYEKEDLSVAREIQNKKKQPHQRQQHSTAPPKEKRQRIT